MTETITLPTPEALRAFGLNRYVSDKTAEDNPFIIFNNKDTLSSNIDNNGESFFNNEVELDVFQYQPIKVTTTSKNGLTTANFSYGQNPKEIKGTYRILLADQDISVNHGHTWESTDSFLSTIYNKLTNGLNDISNGVTMVSNGIKNTGLAGGQFESPIITRTDYQKIYGKSAYPTITLNFVLFTNNNFFGDIYAPLMDLVALTYPTRLDPNQIKQDKQDNAEQSVADQIVQAAANGVKSLAQLGQKAQEFLQLSARQYTFTPPHLFDIYHTSGLYTYPNCYCEGIDIRYSGPWYNNTTSMPNINMNNTLGINVNRRTLPSVATVSMRFSSSELFFSGEFLTMRQQLANIINDGGRVTGR